MTITLLFSAENIDILYDKPNVLDQYFGFEAWQPCVQV